MVNHACTQRWSSLSLLLSLSLISEFCCSIHRGKCHDLNIDWGGDLWYFELIDVDMECSEMSWVFVFIDVEGRSLKYNLFLFFGRREDWKNEHIHFNTEIRFQACVSDIVTRWCHQVAHKQMGFSLVDMGHTDKSHQDVRGSEEHCSRTVIKPIRQWLSLFSEADRPSTFCDWTVDAYRILTEQQRHTFT